MLSSVAFLKIVSMISIFLHASQASPSPVPTTAAGSDQNPTIWSHATIDVMKAQRQKLYEYALAMYNHQTYFEDADNCVNPPVPNVRYTYGNKCPRANLVRIILLLDVLEHELPPNQSIAGQTS